MKGRLGPGMMITVDLLNEQVCQVILPGFFGTILSVLV